MPSLYDSDSTDLLLQHLVNLTPAFRFLLFGWLVVFFFFLFFNRWQNNCRKGEDLICMPSFLQLEGGLQDSTESESEVAHLCLTLCDPMDCNAPGASVCEILQARILVVISASRVQTLKFRIEHWPQREPTCFPRCTGQAFRP